MLISKLHWIQGLKIAFAIRSAARDTPSRPVQLARVVVALLSSTGPDCQTKGGLLLNLEPEADGSTAPRSCFQIAKVTRLLMSVGKRQDASQL